MKANLDLSQLEQNFAVSKSTINGNSVVLITGKHMGTIWTPETLIFRSSMWNEFGELISASFPKFFNWNEKPDITPLPSSLLNTSAVEKIDGSTLIVSKFKNNLIIRTRGTFDVFGFENAKTEIPYLRSKYPQAFMPIEQVSYLFEWYSPKNKIVINYGDEPQLYLIGAIAHDDYSLLTQDTLDELALQLNTPRPTRYTFDDVDTMMKTIESFKGKEGVCLYYHNDQCIRKVKNSTYLMHHAFKSDLSINNLLEVYVDQDRPEYNVFFDYIATTYDYECAETIRGDISKLCDANKEVNKIIEHMKVFADNVRTLPRKDAAAQIISAYGKTSRSGYVFSFLDNKPLDADAFKKLLHQILPK